MKRVLHIIPAWKDACDMEPYVKLASMASAKGYEVVPHNVDWGEPLSEQVFPVSADDVVFGFSLGAVLAQLVAQEYSCQHLILASTQSHTSFTDSKVIKAFKDLCGAEFTEDIIAHLKFEYKAMRRTFIYGDKEGEQGDVLVPNTGHELNSAYLEAINNLI